MKEEKKIAKQKIKEIDLLIKKEQDKINHSPFIICLKCKKKSKVGKLTLIEGYKYSHSFDDFKTCYLGYTCPHCSKFNHTWYDENNYEKDDLNRLQFRFGEKIEMDSKEMEKEYGFFSGM